MNYKKKALFLTLSAVMSAQSYAALPDWTKAGYLEGEPLPSQSDYTTNAVCIITPNELATQFGVYPNDGVDDSMGLQAAIDTIKENCQGSHTNLSLISLPSGEINISKQIGVDANFLTIKGQGNNPDAQTATKIVFAPDVNTRYDNISDFDLGDMRGKGSANGGWIWPGRGAFRVQSRGVHSSYAQSYQSAPANRKDFYEGSVNFHWKNEDIVSNAQKGDTVLTLKNVRDYQVGNYIWVGSANTDKFLEEQGVQEQHKFNTHMRQQMFKITAVDAGAKQVTIDKPLEFDIYTTNTADGSPAIKGSTYKSRAANLDVVEGVGFEEFYLTQVAPAGKTPADAKNNYNNLDHEGAMHGLVFKWAVNSYVKNVRTFMTGSHPIVTEMAKNLQFENNYLEGSWNKGKGGNGYFRNSKLWDSVVKGNVARDVRHITLQWSASGNVLTGNDIDGDLNLHGGWERHNLIENNSVNVPYSHRDCSPNCEPGDETWYPIWYGPGHHAGKWSGATGPQNVFYRNTLKKQLTPNGAFSDFAPYGTTPSVIYQFGWDTQTPEGTQWRHLLQDGTKIEYWTGRETVDYTVNDSGINANCSSTAASLVGTAILCAGGSDDDELDSTGSSSSGSTSSGGATTSGSTSSSSGDTASGSTSSSSGATASSSGSSSGSAGSNCVVYSGGRQDLMLNTSRCVTFANGLEGKNIQFWNNKAGSGCGYKGNVTGSQGGSTGITSSYKRASGFTGTQLNFDAGNGCPKLRIRIY